MFGYAGSVLFINLSERKVKRRKLGARRARSFLGGKGLGVSFLYEVTPSRIDPFSPENVLIIAAGPFVGTSVPTGCRFVAVTKSPLTGLYLDTNCGGHFGPSLRFAGYDALVVTGRAEKPCFLYVEDGEAELLDATHLWGRTTHETEEIIHREVNGDASVVSIGPAAEKLVRFACLTSDSYRNAGRGGAGAVLGSKRLKAIAVYGTKSIPVAEPEELWKRAAELYEQASIDRLGTPGILGYAQETGSLPTRNYQAGVFEDAEKIDGEAMREQLVKRDIACFNCPKACGKLVFVRSGPWKGTRLVGPEYETLGMLGANCGVNDLEAIAHANLLCDRLGIDTVSTGGVIGFAMECYERGVLTEKDTDGLELKFGNAEAMIELVKRIGLREGIGDVLAEGVKRASEKIGRGSERWAVHVKGAELPAWEARAVRGRGLMYALNECGGFHTKGWVSGSDPPNKSALDKVKKLVDSQNRSAVRDSTGLCMFMEISWKDLVHLLNLVTGWKLTPVKCLKIGERIHTLTRAFNVREGFSRKDDKLPPRLMNEATPKGPPAGCKAFVSDEDFEMCLDRYYSLRGWDRNGKPTYETLLRLNLRKAAEDLKGTS
ncbi:MAG: aldehyde ferredoxin oxidoreductase family protein [Candidatus Bathyarchaeia archaeon]